MKIAQRIIAGVVLSVGFFIIGCASSTTQARLDQNFVYNCSLNLLSRGVNPTESEKLCSSAHRAEMEEKKLQSSQAPVMHSSLDSKPAVEAAATPVATPVAETSPANTVTGAPEGKPENRQIANEKIAIDKDKKE